MAGHCSWCGACSSGCPSGVRSVLEHVSFQVFKADTPMFCTPLVGAAVADAKGPALVGMPPCYCVEMAVLVRHLDLQGRKALGKVSADAVLLVPVGSLEACSGPACLEENKASLLRLQGQALVRSHLARVATLQRLHNLLATRKRVEARAVAPELKAKDV